jgi:hypothetical protein
MKETKDFDIFFDLFKDKDTVFYDYNKGKLCLYLGNKQGDEIFEDSVSANWLYMDDRGLSYFVSEKTEFNASGGINFIIALAAFGKDVVVTNFNPVNEIFWEETQSKADELSIEQGNSVGEITFLPKNEEELNDYEKNEKIFLEKIKENPKPKLIYHIGLANFFIYLGENIEHPEEDINDDGNRVTIENSALQSIIGYSGLGYIEQVAFFAAIGFDITIWTKDKSLKKEGFRKDGFEEIHAELNEKKFPSAEVPGKVTFFYYGKEDEKEI